MKEGQIAGLDYFDIYDYTIREITEYIDMVNEKTRREGRRRAIELFQFGNLIGSMLGGKGESNTIYDFFPQYFTEEEVQEAEQERVVNALMAGFARTNARFDKPKAEEAK